MSSQAVYVLVEGYAYEGASLRGVYSSPDQAKRAARTIERPGDWFEIHEVIVDADPGSYFWNEDVEYEAQP